MECYWRPEESSGLCLEEKRERKKKGERKKERERGTEGPEGGMELGKGTMGSWCSMSEDPPIAQTPFFG